MAVDVGSAVGYLDLDISGFLAGLKSAQSEADKQSKNIATTIGNNISGIGKKLTSVGTTLTKNVSVPIVGIGTAVVTMSSNFESAMSKVSAISGATGSDLDKLNEKAQEMGAKTKFSATEAAEAFTYMAMAGWKTEDMLAGIDGIMNLAAADGLDLATTSDIVTDALTAFGLSAGDSAHFADILAKASSAANTNVSMLGESFKYVAPVAGALGYSAEDVAIALGLMANAGIKGSQGGTALRASLSRLIKPTDDAAALMEQYNLSLTNSDGSMKSLGQVMTMLRDNLSDLTEAEQAQVAAALFGQEAMSGMLSIINASDKDFDGLTNQIYSADGAAQQMADTMLNNLKGQITILKSSLEGLALQFGEILLPYLKQFVEWLQNLVQKLQELSPEQKEQIVKWAAIAAAIGPVLLVLGKLVTGVGNTITTLGKIPGAIKTVTGGFTKLVTSTKNVFGGFKLAKLGFTALGAQASPLGAALGGVTVPMLAIVAAVALVIAAFVSLWKNNEEFRNNIIAIWEQVKATFNRLVQGIVDRLNSLGIDFGEIGETLKSIWQGFCDFLAPIFELVFQGIADKFSFFVDIILGALDFFIALFTGDWQGTWDAIKGIFETTWNRVESIFSSITGTIISIGQTVLGWFNVEWNTSVSEVGSFFQNTWQGIADFFIMVWTNARDFFIGLWQTIWNFVGPLFNKIIGTFQNAWDFIVGVWSACLPFFEGIWNGIILPVWGMYEEMIGAFKMAWDVIKLIWEACEPFFSYIWNSIKIAVTTLWDVLVTIFETSWNIIKETASAFWSFMVEGFKIAWEMIKLVWEMVVPYFKVVWETIKGTFSVVAAVLGGFFKIAWEAIKAVWNTVISFFTMIWAGIKAVFAVVKGVLSGDFSDAWEAIKNLWEKAKTFFSSVWNGIKGVFSAVGSWFGNTFKAAWNAIKNVFSAWGSFFGSLWTQIKDKFSNIGTSIANAIGSAVKAGLNGVISAIEGIINSGVNMINGAINLINNIPGVNIGNISKLSLPRLAKGGVVNHRMIAEIGEDGREAVVPLEKNLGWMKNLVAEFMSKLKDLFDNHSPFSDLMSTLTEIKEICRSIMTSEEVGYVSHAGFSKRPKHFTGDNNDNDNNIHGQGDTFNFYSPKPIDEIEAAKQMKKTKRELAEGF